MRHAVLTGRTAPRFKTFSGAPAPGLVRPGERRGARADQPPIHHARPAPGGQPHHASPRAHERVQRVDVRARRGMGGRVPGPAGERAAADGRPCRDEQVHGRRVLSRATEQCGPGRAKRRVVRAGVVGERGEMIDHGGVERGERRQHVRADPGAQKALVRVRRVVDEGQPGGDDQRPDVRACAVEERPDHAVVAAGRDASEPAQRAPAQQTREDRLGLVVTRVPDGNARRALSQGGLPQGGVPRGTCGGLHRRPALHGNGQRAKRHRERLGLTRRDRDVLRRIGTQPVIDRRGDERHAKLRREARESIKESRRVGAARARHEQRPPRDGPPTEQTAPREGPSHRADHVFRAHLATIAQRLCDADGSATVRRPLPGRAARAVRILTESFMRRTLVRRLLAASLVAPLAFALGACGDDDDTPPPPPTDLGPADAGTDLGTDLGAADAGVDAGPAGCTTGCAIEEITSGLFHSCARRENGEVLCWGNNFFRELGDGSGRHLSCPPLFNELPTDCQARPVAVSDLEGATDIEAHNGPTTCARVADGSWKCWGLEFINTGTGQPEELGVATAVPRLDGIVQLGPAFGSACGVTATGGVSCFGSNQEGQLGDGTTTERRTPVAVSGLTGAAEVRSSGNHTCARLTDGGVRCWGSNESGQLGDGVATHGTTCRRGSTDIDCVTAPVTVATIDDATGLAVTGQSTCALRGDGTVWCWGANYFGQLGNGTLTDSNTPVQVSDLTGATAIAAGGSHFCALVAGGAVKCWGLNFDAQLGDNATHELCVFASDSEDCSKVPVNVSGLTGVTQLALGASHSCALTAEGVSCWGDNVVYQSGTRASMRVTTPTAVAGVP